MLSLELFAWFISIVLALSFITSLIVVSKRPQSLTKKKQKKQKSID